MSAVLQLKHVPWLRMSSLLADIHTGQPVQYSRFLDR